MSSLEPVVPGEELEDAASERAADFFGRRRSGEWSDADQAELDAWLAESILHEVAHLRVEGIAARADQLAAFRALRLTQARSAGKTNFRYGRFIIPVLAAASVALATTLGWPFVKSLMQPPTRTDSTDIGGRTLLSFADRTQIELNTDTVVRFRMTSTERTVWLEKGEAWFHVAHNAANPFTVIIGKHRVTDLGTEFLVRRDTNDVDVALLNGRASLSAEGVQTATLTPGDEAVATQISLSVVRKSPQQLADEMAWRQGMIVFDHTPLATAVREFNRYNEIKLVIADPTIANLKIGGKFQTNNIDTFLALVKSVLNVHAERTASGILLSRNRQAAIGREGHAERFTTETLGQ